MFAVVLVVLVVLALVLVAHNNPALGLVLIFIALIVGGMIVLQGNLSLEWMRDFGVNLPRTPLG